MRTYVRACVRGCVGGGGRDREDDFADVCVGGEGGCKNVGVGVAVKGYDENGDSNI